MVVDAAVVHVEGHHITYPVAGRPEDDYSPIGIKATY